MIENVAPKFSKKPIKVIGCGLAGAEVAFILANNGFDVHIFDNGSNERKERFDYYDKYEIFMTENMKYELECLNSPILSISKKIDYKNFGFEYDSEFFEIIKQNLQSNPKIKYFDCSIDTLSDTEMTVVSTGHHTDKRLLKELKDYVGSLHTCSFQPEKMVVDAETVNLNRLNFVNSTDCYVNLSKEEYDELYSKILEFDKKYELPEDLQEEKQITIEKYAQRGQGGLRNALFRPRLSVACEQEQQQPYASLKLTYNASKNVLILDDFYSALDEDEQKQILYCINFFKNCEILRYSKIKKKTYLLAPACLNEKLQIKDHENIYVCGGLCGTAGSFESLLVANFCAYEIIAKRKGNLGVELLRENTCIGMLLDNLLNKSVINFRLINLKYDIIDKEDLEMKNFNKHVEVQKILSKSQIEKFKEKFYGKYF